MDNRINFGLHFHTRIRSWVLDEMYTKESFSLDNNGWNLGTSLHLVTRMKEDIWLDSNLVGDSSIIFLTFMLHCDSI